MECFTTLSHNLPFVQTHLLLLSCLAGVPENFSNILSLFWAPKPFHMLGPLFGVLFLCNNGIAGRVLIVDC